MFGAAFRISYGYGIVGVGVGGGVDAGVAVMTIITSGWGGLVVSKYGEKDNSISSKRNRIIVLRNQFCAAITRVALLLLTA